MQICLFAPRSLSASFLVLMLSLGFGACVGPQLQDSTESTGFLPASGLDELQPADIAVARVEVALFDSGDAPREALRKALYDGLIERLYSPLPLAWVDAGGERDATLVVRILEWDRTKLAYEGTVMARAEARLVANGSSLWAVEVTRKLNRQVSGAQRDDPQLAELSSARHLAQEILKLLPERDPRR